MAYRLRYQAHDLEMPMGEFLIGRSAECQLALDDPLVSRKHAALRVRRDGVTVEDLGSRNGVLVNGARIDGPTPVGDADRISIGGQELRVIYVDETTEALAREQYRRHTQTLGMGAAELEAQLASAVTAPPPVAVAAQSSSVPVQPGDATTNARGIHSFQLLGGVADKALALGRAEEAERILQALLQEILRTSREGKPAEPNVIDQAARYATRIGGATNKASWIDYVFDLYAAVRRPAPAAIVDELYTTVRKIKSLEGKALRAYLAVLRDAQPSFGPAERFVVQRIEGLERLIAAK
ncbi:MAG: FHA domain-containing protein [Polyangiaceae bacterium]